MRRLLLHDSSFVLLGLAVLILVAGCILIFPRALVPDTPLDKQRTMPLGEFTTARNDARSTLINAVAGLLLGVTAVFTWQQLAISREGQITERFTRAVELLAAYIRNHSPYRPGRRPVTAPTGPATGDAATDARQEERADRVDCERRFHGLASLQKCAFDIYLALQVLGQRPETLSDGRPFVPSLLDTDLRGAQLGSAPLHSADLRGAVLDDLSCWSQGPPFTDLGEALLQGVSLKGARLYGTDLHGRIWKRPSWQVPISVPWICPTSTFMVRPTTPGQGSRMASTRTPTACYRRGSLRPAGAAARRADVRGRSRG